MNNLKVKHGKFVNKQENTKEDFYCNSLGLTTLKNCPDIVDGCFGCSHNKLTNLKHCPKASVINCSDNFYLTDISDLPSNCQSINLTNCDDVEVFTTDIDSPTKTLTFIFHSNQSMTLGRRIKQWPYYEIVSEGLRAIKVRIKPDNEVFMDSL